MDDNTTEKLYSVQTAVSQNVSSSMSDIVDFMAREWILVIGLSLMIVCVIFGNILTLTAIAKHRPLKTPPVYLIASLAVADLMVGLMVMPLSLSYELTVQWKLGVALCDLWVFLDVLCCTASILNLCVIALDRYWAITKPLEYKPKRTSRRMLTMIIVVWVISLVISTIPLFLMQSEDPHICRISQDLAYTIVSTFGAFFIPMTIMMVVYARIFVEARKRIHGRASAFSTPLGSTSEMSDQRWADDLSTRISSFLRKVYKSEPVIAEAEGPYIKLRSPTRVGKQRRKSSPNIITNKDLLPQSPRRTFSAQNTPSQGRSGYLSKCPSQVSSSQCLKMPCSPLIRKRLMQRRQLAAAREQKAVKTLAIVTGTFLICWLPFFIAALVLPFCPQCDLPAFWKSLFLWLGYFNSMINPILYTKFNKDFKDAFSKLLHCSKRQPTIINNPSKKLTHRCEGHQHRPTVKDFISNGAYRENIKTNKKSKESSL